MTGFFTAEHILGQQLILVKQDGQVGFGQGFGTAGLAHDRLHGKLVKAEIIRHVEQVVGEIGVDGSYCMYWFLWHAFNGILYVSGSETGIFR